MAKLLDAGVDVVRFNVKHQSQVRGRRGTGAEGLAWPLGLLLSFVIEWHGV